jgi:ABC-type sugar transport system ATPase subunit
MTDNYLWEALDIGKSFGPTAALAGASLQLRPGEIHALVGENGAGKSTMSKVACVAFPVDRGKFRLSGEYFEPRSLTRAASRGVGLVFQESMIIPVLSIAENIFIDKLRQFRRGGLLDRSRLRRQASKHLVAAGADFDVDAEWSTLSLGQRKMVELARALASAPRLLFVDEATAVLDSAGRDLLLAALRRLRDQGVGICYISHHMEEIFSLSDQVTVMRDGQTIATLETARTSRSELESLMVGREIADSLYPTRHPIENPSIVLTVEGLGYGEQLHDISFELRSGEVLGIAGLAGCGGTELLRVIAGVLRASVGSMFLDSEVFAPHTTRDAMRQGIAYLPGDRDGEGLLGGASIRENIGLTTLPQTFHLVNNGAERQTAKSFVASLRIKARSVEQTVDGLSGGNRQKVVLGKLLATSPRILLLDNPTRGVDIGARAHVYEAITAAIAAGMAVLLLSEDLPEVMGLSDRLLVMRRGHVSHAFPETVGLTERQVLSHML